MNPPVRTTPLGEPKQGAAWVMAQSLLLAALVASGPLHPGDWHSPTGLAVGVILFLAAGFIGVAGVVNLGGNRTPFPAPRPGSTLVRSGVYGWCRHPLYASVMLAGFSWALLWQGTWTLGLAVVQVPFFVAKARAEERLLRRAFPDYETYARQVKAFLPGVF